VRLTQNHSYDVIIAHQPFAAFNILRAAADENTLQIYICHSLSFEEYISRNKKPSGIKGRLAYALNIIIRKYIEKWTLRRVSKIVVLSEFTQHKLLSEYHTPSDKIVLIPGGVDLNRFRPAGDKTVVRKRLGVPQNKVVLLTVRNLVPRMGLENLIRAASLIKAATPDFYLIIGGQGPLMPTLKKLIQELDLTDRVELPGFIPDESLPGYYRAADLFVLPTKELEGFGLVTLEALASGVPMLGTPVGGTLEIIRKFNPEFIFSDATPTAMAEQMNEKYQTVHAAPDQWELVSARCRAFVEANYSWDMNVHQLEALIEANIDQHSKKRIASAN